ncbi:DUF3426 domain-containing protein [Roseateles sp. DAIF2]|uniref:zinc-ribbon and DUF3426 domain-containing protein n=1 Tax=Roseateles sp. DAIF2 TaxID=2714952 RepID=UPI0018A33B1E|nr:zinc-ribbon and DUF3426 domain-containing protein [Roseateles sp. DAIF2]QPF76460.1 DUF3426 domain-containing protein [Roseateles sp. DAIF2]
MSLATRCTACGTIFRVVQDQLRVSEGWVRCGRCAEVFDANEQLFDIDREMPPPWPPAGAADQLAAPRHEEEAALAAAADAALEPEAPAPRPPHRHAEDEETWVLPRTPDAVAAPREAIASFETEPRIALETPAAASHNTLRITPVERDDAHDEAIPPPPARNPAARDAAPQRREPYWSGDEAAPAEEEDHQAGFSARAPEPQAAIAAEPEIDLEPAAAASTFAPEQNPTPPQASFLRQPAAARPRVRLALLLASALLLILLALQLTWQLRHALLAIYPPSAPLLRSFCELGGCTLEPWRRIDALAVENSSLTQAGAGNHYKLSVHLRNKAAYPLALPWVDLSLTDASGALVMRRMLKPADFNIAKGSIGGDAEEALQLVFSTGKQKISGYSVVIFHP